jgi:hypothetical protein
MAEPDHREPDGEVEIGAPRVVPDATPLTADDRDVGTRVGGQDGIAGR